jgi:hypothetical protein
MKAGIKIQQTDSAYVEERGGIELLSHLRAGPARADYRGRAIERAYERFERAVQEGAPEAEIGGYGLLVLQRALLAGEDLGGVLHAFASDEPWPALRLTTIPTLGAAFERALTDPADVLRESFRLTTEEQLAEEGYGPKEVIAFKRLRSRTESSWKTMLRRVAILWTSGSGIAKATMHGFPVIAGSLVVGPPRAGELAEIVEAMLNGVVPQRFAAAVPAKVSGATVNTEVALVDLGDAAVAQYRAGGLTATRLYAHICEAQAISIVTRHGAMLSGRLLHTLPEEDRALIGPLLSAAQEDDEDATP